MIRFGQTEGYMKNAKSKKGGDFVWLLREVWHAVVEIESILVVASGIAAEGSPQCLFHTQGSESQGSLRVPLSLISHVCDIVSHGLDTLIYLHKDSYFFRK